MIDCFEGGGLSILRRKVVDGYFLWNRETFCLCIFIINIGGWLEKSKWDRYVWLGLLRRWWIIDFKKENCWWILFTEFWSFLFVYFYHKYRELVRKVEMEYSSKDTYDWGCYEDGELSILRRKVVDGSFLRNHEAFVCVFLL